MTEVIGTKVCRGCGQPKPLDQFRFQRRDQNRRHPRCNECFAAYMRQRTTRLRERAIKGQIEELATDMSNPASFGATTRSEAIVKAMLTRFGGLEKFADEWFRFLRLAHLAGKHHVVQRSFEGMLRLMSVLDTHQNTRSKSLDEMTDRELQAFITQAFVERLWANPEIGVAVLERMGWTLTPPDASKQLAFEGSAVGDVQRRLMGLLRTPCEKKSTATLLLEADEDDGMDQDDDDWLDDREFELLAAQESGESGGLSF